VVSIEEALKTAQAKELDLVEVSPSAEPPVCKIMDFGKYIYTQKKIETKHKKSQKKTVVKCVRLTFKIGEHDLNVRINQAKKFLESGNVVKVSMLFRGREIVYKDLGKEKFVIFQEALKELSNVESPATLQGNTLQMMLTPTK
jgi:translation initiation factor IF-3